MPTFSGEFVPGSIPNKRDDRRAAPRFDCTGVADIRLPSISSRMSGKILDMSSCGCRIEVNQPLPAVEDPVIEVVLSLRERKLRVPGIVRNVCGENRVGIQFIDVPERKAAQIKELLAELSCMENRLRQVAALGQESARALPL